MRITANPKDDVILRIDFHAWEELDQLTCVVGTCPVDVKGRPECQGCPNFRRRIFRRIELLKQEAQEMANGEYTSGGMDTV